MSTVALNNLWTYIESMGLSTKNRQWLADRLIEPRNRRTTTKSSLRTAFHGDWGTDADYAQMLREENVLAPTEIELW